MLKSKVFTSLTVFIWAAAFASTLGFANVAQAAGNDDVFMDEGDGDFDAPPVAAPPAAAPAKEVKVEKAPAPRPAAPPVEATDEMPMLTDDSAPTIVAPTEEPSAPVAAEPKEKKAKKQKPAKKASKTAATVAVSGGGSFVVTREACPMMRTPASTAETMLTVKASKKIWVEDAGDGWVKGFNKAGEPGYISKECLQ